MREGARRRLPPLVLSYGVVVTYTMTPPGVAVVVKLTHQCCNTVGSYLHAVVDGLQLCCCLSSCFHNLCFLEL